MDTSSIIVIAAAAALLFFLLHIYNRLVRLRNKVRNAWSDIDVTLERRHDLVPGLVETVRGYMAHERETLENVTRARAEAISSGGSNVVARAAAELALTGAIGNVFAKVENYPALRAAENMQLLQEQLTSTENRIAFARQCYNDFVREYNTALATFPRNLIAGALGFSPASLFEAEETSRGECAGEGVGGALAKNIKDILKAVVPEQEVLRAIRAEAKKKQNSRNDTQPNQ